MTVQGLKINSSFPRMRWETALVGIPVQLMCSSSGRVNKEQIHRCFVSLSLLYSARVENHFCGENADDMSGTRAFFLGTRWLPSPLFLLLAVTITHSTVVQWSTTPGGMLNTRPVGGRP